MKLCVVAVFVLLITVDAEDNYSGLIEQAVSLVKDGLKEFPHIHLHFHSPEHEDLTRLQTWVREHVPNHVEELLKEIVERCTTLVKLKQATLDSLKGMVKNDIVEEESSLTELQKDLLRIINSMLQEMEEGKGSLDFEMDDVSRTSLGDVYFYVKNKIQSELRTLKECPSRCGLSHPYIVKSLEVLHSSTEETLNKVSGILLGSPGLDSKFVRPQLLRLRSSIPNIEEDLFGFLVSLGEWLNDVLNSGLRAMWKPFGELGGQMIEILGSTKDRIVPEIREALSPLEERKDHIEVLLQILKDIVQKYFGKF